MSLVRSGKQNHVPVIVGSTADEFTTLAPVMLRRKVRTEEEYQAAIASYFSSIISVVPVEDIRAAYPTTAYPNRKEAMIAMVADFVYTCSARMLTRALALSHRAPVRRFLYAHTFSSPGWSEYRAGHGFELAYLFGPIPPEWYLRLDQSEQAFSSQMIRAWVNVPNTGSPHVSDFDWPPYDTPLNNYLVLDTPTRAGTGFRKVQCDLWAQYEAQLYP